MQQGSGRAYRSQRMLKPQRSHFHQRLALFWARRAQFLYSHPVIALLTFVIASVWMVFGTWFKLLGMVPRHRLIIAAVVGEAAAGPITLVVGAAETALALWIISGVYPRICAAAQSLAIVTMNTFELIYARNLLLSPGLMICLNAVLLTAVWCWALTATKTRS
jgi:hypothetical protein